MRHDEQIRTSQSGNAGTHLNCAQSVVSTYCEEFGLDRNLGLKAAMDSGWMARTGKTCGAVTGVYMILGLSQRINEIMPARVSREPTN